MCGGHDSTPVGAVHRLTLLSCTLQELSLQHVTNIMLASARMQMHQDLPSMLPIFVDEIFRRLRNEHFNAQQLSNLLWALAIQQVGHCNGWDVQPGDRHSQLHCEQGCRQLCFVLS